MPANAIRKQATSIYGDLYTFFQHNPQNPFTCFYCGDTASCMDHVPPLSRVDDYRALRLRHEYYIKVPCCNECNSVLGNSLQIHIIDRVCDAHDILENRHKKHLKCKAWTKQALDYAQFRGRLKSYVLASENMRKYIADRVDYWKGLNAFLEEIDPEHEIDFMAVRDEN